MGKQRETKALNKTRKTNGGEHASILFLRVGEDTLEFTQKLESLIIQITGITGQAGDKIAPNDEKDIFKVNGSTWGAKQTH